MFELGDRDINDAPEVQNAQGKPDAQAAPYVPAIGGAPSFGVAQGNHVPGYSGVGHTYDAPATEDE